jgi:hypothetical protein
MELKIRKLMKNEVMEIVIGQIRKLMKDEK